MQSFVLLRKVADFYPAADLHSPRRRLQLARQNAQQRRFARPVRPHQTHAVAATHQQRDISQNGVIAERSRDVLHLHHPFGAFGGRMKGEIIKSRRFRRQYDTLQPIELALAPPRLLRLNPRLVAPDVFLGRTDMLLLFQKRRFQRRAPRRPHLEKITVVPLINDYRPLIELKNFRRYPVKEKTIVRDEENSARIAG